MVNYENNKVSKQLYTLNYQILYQYSKPSNDEVQSSYFFFNTPVSCESHVGKAKQWYIKFVRISACARYVSEQATRNGSAPIKKIVKPGLAGRLRMNFFTSPFVSTIFNSFSVDSFIPEPNYHLRKPGPKLGNKANFGDSVNHQGRALDARIVAYDFRNVYKSTIFLWCSQDGSTKSVILIVRNPR